MAFTHSLIYTTSVTIFSQNIYFQLWLVTVLYFIGGENRRWRFFFRKGMSVLGRDEEESGGGGGDGGGGGGVELRGLVGK